MQNKPNEELVREDERLNLASLEYNMEVNRMPANRLFVSSVKQEGSEAISDGPLERQSSVAVVTHIGARLF